MVVVGPDWDGNHPVFLTGFGTPVEPRNFNRFWDRRCEAANVRRITVHDARRTCGSITMEIYTNVPSAATREALRRLGEALDQ